MTNTDSLGSPHCGITPSDARERFALRFLDALWTEYRQRVSYVRDYEEVVKAAGGTFENDHIAFRTIASQDPLTGIATLARVFEALGYQPAGSYQFLDKHLSSLHFQHPSPGFPKIFISELRVWELAADMRETLWKYTSQNPQNVANEDLATVFALQGHSVTKLPEDAEGLLKRLTARFFQRPWQAPEHHHVEAVNKVSQFGAWVLVHGYAVNHFTALVNSHGVSTLDDIEKTINAMRNYGVPMKYEIEGERGSKLRQSATEAVKMQVPVTENGKETTAPWTYAYFEIAERGEVTDPETGRSGRFEGFLGPQATQLFEMTRVGK